MLIHGFSQLATAPGRLAQLRHAPPQLAAIFPKNIQASLHGAGCV